MDIEVSIIYVNYNTSHLIAESIKSVLRNVRDITYEIIIVDNNSEKDLENKLSGILPVNIRVEYIFLQENVGFGRANNAGAKLARGNCLFLLNPDTLLLNNAIKLLYDFISVHEKVGVCGGNLYDINDTPVFSFRKIFPGPNWEFQELTRHILLYPKNKRKRFFNYTRKPFPVAYVSGANLMIKSAVFKECKGFPEDLFMYWDDVEICKRVKDLGYEVYSVPEARICHLESRSFENINKKNSFKIELQEKYRIVYLKRNVGKFRYHFSNLLYYLFMQSRVMLLPKGPKKDFYKTHKQFFKKYKKQFDYSHK